MSAIGKKWNQFMDYLGFRDSDLDDEEAYEKYEQELERKNKSKGTTSSYSGQKDVSAKTIKNDRERNERMKAEAVAHGADSTFKAHTVSNYDSTTYVDSKNNRKILRMERPAGSKSIPINTTHYGNEVCIMQPVTFEDSQDICDVLLSKRIAIVNLENIEIDTAQRIMDFIAGSVYTMNGKLYPIHGFIFIITPEGVDISGDYNELIEQSGFNVPILK